MGDLIVSLYTRSGFSNTFVQHKTLKIDNFVIPCGHVISFSAHRTHAQMEAPVDGLPQKYSGKLNENESAREIFYTTLDCQIKMVKKRA